MKFTAKSYPGENGSHAVLIAVQDPAWAALRVLLDRSAAKHSGYLTWSAELPHKPRTLKGSRKFHALVSRLCPLVDMSFDECKAFCKMEATALGYRVKTRRIGNRVRTLPVSESEASTEEESYLINTALKIGAEVGHDLEAEYVREVTP